MIPVHDAASTTNVRHHEVTLRIVDVCGPKLFQGPGTRHNCVAFHVLVPFERTGNIAFCIEWKFGSFAVEEDDVVITAST